MKKKKKKKNWRAFHHKDQECMFEQVRSNIWSGKKLNLIAEQVFSI